MTVTGVISVILLAAGLVIVAPTVKPLPPGTLTYSWTVLTLEGVVPLSLAV